MPSAEQPARGPGLTPDQADSQRPSYLPLWTINSANLLSADPVKWISLVFVVHILSCS